MGGEKVAQEDVVEDAEAVFEVSLDEDELDEAPDSTVHESGAVVTQDRKANAWRQPPQDSTAAGQRCPVRVCGWLGTSRLQYWSPQRATAGISIAIVFHLSALHSSHSVRTPQAGVPYTYVGGLLTSALAKRSY